MSSGEARGKRRLQWGLLMRAKFLAAAASLVLAPGAALAAEAGRQWPACGTVEAYPGREWRASDPARHGWDEAKLAEAKAIFDGLQSAAVMVVHRGRLIAQWGSVETPYTAQSVRKALLNSLVGGLVDDDSLSLDATLADLGINDSDPELTESERQATVRDLLQSRSGIFHSALYEIGGWTRARKALAEAEKSAGRDLFPAGAIWIYNNWDFNALGTVVENAARQEIGPLFAERIAGPIGMQDFAPEDVEYTTRDHPAEKRFGNSSDHRAYVFDISTRDFARYGVLQLGCGKWKRNQVLSREWVLESIDGIDTRIGRNDEQRETGFGDYGYLWQIDRPGSRRYVGLPTREPMYMATGNRGHVMFVLPYLDLVIAHQVATLGGVAMEAQMKRATEGSPEVADADIERLVAAIIAAHPKGKTALGAE
jgi:CubicO group peptidase (beta-lactamase class C family)